MSKVSWLELFPTKASLVIFASYIFLFSIQGILVTASQGENSEYQFNITTVVLLTEFTKLVASVVLYCKDNSFVSLLGDIRLHVKVFALYLIPAFLYSLYNNLAFVNLSEFDPTTYNVLLQFRVVITAVLFQIIFKRKLSRKQWFSLALLTIGCMVKQINFDDDSTQPTSTERYSQKHVNVHLGIGALFLLLQTLCSCLAGVYNEHLLKNSGADVNIFVQNVFMYLDSILCNAVILVINGKLGEALTVNNLEKVFQYKVLLIVATNATVGIITSFFLKTLNSILKVFASSLELVLVALFSYVLLRIPIYINTVLSICTVLVAVYLYSQNPVVNATVKKPQKHESELELLKEEV